MQQIKSNILWGVCSILSTPCSFLKLSTCYWSVHTSILLLVIIITHPANRRGYEHDCSRKHFPISQQPRQKNYINQKSYRPFTLFLFQGFNYVISKWTFRDSLFLPAAREVSSSATATSCGQVMVMTPRESDLYIWLSFFFFFLKIKMIEFIIWTKSSQISSSELLFVDLELFQYQKLHRWLIKSIQMSWLWWIKFLDVLPCAVFWFYFSSMCICDGKFKTHKMYLLHCFCVQISWRWIQPIASHSLIMFDLMFCTCNVCSSYCVIYSSESSAVLFMAWLCTSLRMNVIFIRVRISKTGKYTSSANL